MIYRNLRKLSPDGLDGNGGNSAQGDGGNADASQTQSTQSTTPARDFGRDIDSMRHEFGGKFNEISGFISDYRKANAPRTPESDDSAPVLGSQKYPQTQEGVSKFLEDQARFISRREFKELQASADQARVKQDGELNTRKSLQAHFARHADARKEYSDFDTVIAGGFNVPDSIAKEVLDSDISAHLQYHLTKNSMERMNVLMAFQESNSKGLKALAKIEHKIETDLAAKKAAKAKTRFGATETFDTETQGQNDDQENEDIARSSYRLGKKSK